MNAQILADQLHTKGFRTSIVTSNGIVVSLSSRSVYEAEIHLAMDELGYNKSEYAMNPVYRENNFSVLVTWENS